MEKMVLSKNEWVKFFEAYSIMLILNPKSEYRNPSVICFALHGINPKQYLNTKFKTYHRDTLTVHT